MWKAYRHGRIDSDDIALFYEQLAGLVAQLSNLVLWDGTARAELLDGSGLGQYHAASI